MTFHCKHCLTPSDERLKRCPKCRAYGSFQTGPIQTAGHILDLSDVRTDTVEKIKTLPEVDETFDGGIVPGSVYLVGGEPGIGKSTLLLQLLAKLTNDTDSKGLYISGEESSAHVKIRADRTELPTGGIRIIEETDAERIESALIDECPEWAVLDSMQAIHVPELGVGSMQGQREVISRLYRACHRMGTTLFVISHINKDGDLAGPKALEHYVDVVASFEGDRRTTLRTLRCVKNRFGQTPSMGLFRMTGRGMISVTNPSSELISQKGTSPGSAIACVWVCGKPLLVNVQVLAGAPSASTPRRAVTGLPTGRVAQVQAVLERRVKVGLGARDLYSTIVGGMDVDDVGVDLALAMALASAAFDRALPPGIAYSGEIDLLGNVSDPGRADERKRAAEKAGYALLTFDTLQDAIASF